MIRASREGVCQVITIRIISTSRIEYANNILGYINFFRSISKSWGVVLKIVVREPLNKFPNPPDLS